jgi:hypothetical protein
MQHSVAGQAALEAQVCGVAQQVLPSSQLPGAEGEFPGQAAVPTMHKPSQRGGGHASGGNQVQLEPSHTAQTPTVDSWSNAL